MKLIIPMVCLLVLFAVGCSSKNARNESIVECGYMASCPEGYTGQFIGGQCLICNNNATFIGNFSLKMQECPVQTCPECKPEVQTVVDTECMSRQGEIIRQYAQCLMNVTELQMEVTGDCARDLIHCNETLTDYTGRLDNISWYASENR